MALIDDIAQHLHNQSIGVLASTLFKSYLPDDTSKSFMIGVFDTGGPEPDRELPIENPTFQILIRCDDYSTGKTKLDAIKTALHRKTNTNLGVSTTKYYYFIYALSDGGHLGQNDRGQEEFSINFICKTR